MRKLRIRLDGIRYLLVAAAAAAVLQGCCDATVQVGGRVRDASNSAPLDSVLVTLMYHTQSGAAIVGESLTDSLGRFGFYDQGYCGKDHLFVVASRQGYHTQSLDVEMYTLAADVMLSPL